MRSTFFQNLPVFVTELQPYAQPSIFEYRTRTDVRIQSVNIPYGSGPVNRLVRVTGLAENWGDVIFDGHALPEIPYAQIWKKPRSPTAVEVVDSSAIR